MESLEETITRYQALSKQVKDADKRNRLKQEIVKLQKYVKQRQDDSIIKYAEHNKTVTVLSQRQDDSIIKYAELLPGNIDSYEFEERAAIIEYDGKKPRHEAEKQAYNELKKHYKF